jgi:hypothetical protein
MLRITMSILALFAFSSATLAGELDRESSSKSNPPMVVASSPAKAPQAGTELDRESPQSAHHGHGGWGGFHGGWGYGGGWGGYRGGWGYGGFYRPFGFYRPYSMFYGGFYPYASFGYSPFGWNNFAWYW